MAVAFGSQCAEPSNCSLLLHMRRYRLNVFCILQHKDILEYMGTTHHTVNSECSMLVLSSIPKHIVTSFTS